MKPPSRNVELRDVLTDENHQSLLPQAAGKTEDQVREMIATLRPRPAPADLFRRAPVAVGSGRNLTRLSWFADDLAKVRALLGHKIPDGDLEKILHECIRLGIQA